MYEFWLSLFDRTVKVACSSERLRSLLLEIYGAMESRTGRHSQVADLEYVVSYVEGQSRFSIERFGQEPVYASDDGMFIYLFEKDMTIELERLRHALYFLHAASLEYKSKIHLLVAESGGGKSTTCWGLMHHGFNYASDELAPVNLDTMDVNPYPHALCLKQNPPEPYRLPEATITTSRTLHVPANVLPCRTVSETLPLYSIFFIRYNPEAIDPSVEPVSMGAAGARIYANGLNQLAHPGDGLDAALQIAAHCRCYALETAELNKTSLLIRGVLESDMQQE